MCGVVPPGRVEAFYDAFHRHLAEQGVDGVKVDNQSSLEYSAAGLGGRVRLARSYRRAMEQSARRYFAGRLINCMSCSNEMTYLADDSSLMRTSTDFWPMQPETHGAHLYTNAQVGMWFGEFIHPDWDMFQSGHPMGAYHAVARAVSGSPGYVSDPPDAHDFEVLRRLVCTDGTVLRCTGIGRPSPDCLFHDPTRENVLLKIFNFNEHGAVLGVFHAGHTDRGTAAEVSGAVSTADVPGLGDGSYAVLAHRSGELRRLAPGDRWPVRLGVGEWEIFTFAPVRHGRASLGLADKYNAGGAVRNRLDAPDRMSLSVRDGGELVLWAERRPAGLTVDGEPADWDYDPPTGKVTARLAAAGNVLMFGAD
jgi:raffinose synthase